MSRWIPLACAVLVVVVAPAVFPQEEPVGFSSTAAGTQLPEEWRHFELHGVKRATQWELVEDDGGVVLRGASDQGASLVYSAVDIDPAATPVVGWRWKIASHLADSDLSNKKTDDAAARVYVAFRWDPDLDGPWQKIVGPWQRMKYRLARSRYGEMPPFAAIVYIWASKEPAGWTAANPSFERAIQVVARTENDPAGVWVEESRNVAEDFRRAFGFDPPPISHVAFMVDTDNTKGAAQAWFGDIRFSSEQ